jgi:transcriptional regulator with XRE-family HTH domain
MNIYAIGNNIKLFCRMKNKSLHILADEIGVGDTTMSYLCNGRRQITAYGLYRVSKVLGVSMERLMEGIEDE